MFVVDRAPRALVLAPTDAAHRPVVEATLEALKLAGVDAIRLDDSFPHGGRFQDALTDAVEQADFVIIDLAPASSWSLFEAGYVLATRKPKLLLVHKPELTSGLPFDLFAYEVVLYTLDDLDNLRALIAPAIRSLAQRVTLAA